MPVYMVERELKGITFVHESAKLPFSRIVEAMDLTP